MSGGFSSALRLTDLDDFITPSQECIKPVQKPEAPPTQPSTSKIKIELEDDGSYTQISNGSKESLSKVSVTLSDCLACSGCVTSAESVLISQQGPEELMKTLEKNKNSKLSLVGELPTICIITLGVQAVLSLAERFNLSAQKAAEYLAGMFISLGADCVTTTTLGENLALIESRNEFISHYQEAQSKNQSMTPILTGVCPGWVCYAEKLHGHSLPYISRVKSPQQIMGSLIKLLYSKRKNYTPDQIYHVSVMSCFDRKLEASREDFYLKEYRVKEVDSVITPVEIEQLLDTLGKSLTDFQSHKLENLFPLPGEAETASYPLMSHFGSGSGGYAEFVLRSSAKVLFNEDIENVDWNQGRNPDIWDAKLSGSTKLKFSIATGFRNIQTLVRKLKSKALASNLPNYIEIMACPTGCMNGGAQSRPSVEKIQSRELSFKLEKDYHNLPLVSELNDPTTNMIFETLGASDSELYQTVLYTQFHAIEKLSNLGIKW